MSAEGCTHSTTGFSANVTNVSGIRTQKLQTLQCAHVRKILIETRSISVYGRRYSANGFSVHGTPLMEFLSMGLPNRIFCVCFLNFMYMHAETPDLSMCAYVHNPKRDTEYFYIEMQTFHYWVFCAYDTTAGFSAYVT